LSLIKAIAAQLGLSGDPAKNFTLSVPAAPDGTMKLARGNAGATTQDILTVDANGKVAFPQNLMAFLRAQSASGSIGTGTVFTPLTGWSAQEGQNYGTIADAGTWTPNIAGWYQINFQSSFASSGITASTAQAQLQKNGALYARAGHGSDSQTFPIVAGSAVVYMNGTTDTLRVGAAQNGSIVAPSVVNSFTAALVRAA